MVAVEFLSDDAPEKVLAYYKEQLKKYGGVLECHTTSDDLTGDLDAHDNSSDQLHCGHDNRGKNIELKVGTKDSQHIVSIKPQANGKGTDFALVFVETHGGKKDMI